MARAFNGTSIVGCQAARRGPPGGGSVVARAIRLVLRCRAAAPAENVAGFPAGQVLPLALPAVRANRQRRAVCVGSIKSNL